MAIIINIDVMLARRKMSVTELAEKIGITMANVSILKTARRSSPAIDAESNLQGPEVQAVGGWNIKIS